MSSIGDLTVNVTCDTSDLTAGMTESRQQLEQTVTTIEMQDTSWKSLAGTAISSLGRIVGPAITLIAAQKQLAAATIAHGAASAAATPPTLTFAAAVNFLMSPIVLIAAAVAAAAAVLYFFCSAGDEATTKTDKAAKATKKAGEAADEAGPKLSAMARIWEGFQVGSEMDKVRTSVATVGDASGEVQTAWGGLKDALTQPFVDAAFSVGQFLGEITGIESKAGLATRALQGIAGGINSMTGWAKTGIAAVTMLGYQLATGANAAAAANWLEQRNAIQAVAIEAERARVANEFAQKEVKSLFKEATEAAKQQAEITRIGAITSVEALDKETKALEEQIAKLKLKGKYDEDAAKAAAERARAIANQREGVESGRIKPKDSPVDEAIKSARQSLLALQQGQDEAAIAALKAKGATDEQVASLRELQGAINAAKKAQEDAKAVDEAIESARKSLFALEHGQDEAAIAALRAHNATEEQIQTLQALQAQTKAVKQAQDEAKAAQEALTKAAEDRARIDQQGVDKITSLKDQIDLLRGSATQAEITMRELARAGFSQEQINEIGALTAELDALKEKKKDDKAGNTSLKAAFAGSSEALSIALRGVGPDVASQQLNVAKQQLSKLGEINAAISAKGKSDVAPVVPPRPLPESPLPVMQPTRPEGVSQPRLDASKAPPSPAVNPTTEAELAELRATAEKVAAARNKNTSAAPAAPKPPQPREIPPVQPKPAQPAGFFDDQTAAMLSRLKFGVPESPKFDPLRVEPFELPQFKSPKIDPLPPLKVGELKPPKFDEIKPPKFDALKVSKPKAPQPPKFRRVQAPKFQRLDPPKFQRVRPPKIEAPKFEPPKLPKEPVKSVLANATTARKTATDALQTAKDQRLSVPAANILSGAPAGSERDKTESQKIAKQQLAELKKITAGIKDSKPPALSVAKA